MKKQLIGVTLLALGLCSSVLAAETDQNVPVQDETAAFITPHPAGLLDTPGTSIPASKESEKGILILSQSEPGELSHTALSSALQNKDLSYYVKTGGALPIYDKTFRDFIDYGASVAFGVEKKIQSDLSVSASFDFVIMTGNWKIKGDRQSIEVAAQEWTPGIQNDPGQLIINPEDAPEDNLGTGYHGIGRGIVTSSENLKTLDVHTDLYLFPFMVSALYQIHQEGKINPYVGGGVGYCIATRDTTSHAIKEKYFEGPDYAILRNTSQTVRGGVLQLLAGVLIPINDKMKFVAEANTTLFDLKSFDPILEISMKKTNPPFPLTGNDLTTFSYEEPMEFGVFHEQFITNLSVGIVMPF
jgi:opacity protein-like surface antigen